MLVSKLELFLTEAFITAFCITGLIDCYSWISDRLIPYFPQGTFRSVIAKLVIVIILFALKLYLEDEIRYKKMESEVEIQVKGDNNAK